jgi:hypothetical protein
MSDPSDSSPEPSAPKLSPEKYARLKAEARAPYKGIRKFFYLAFGLSGLLGGFIFFFKVLAGRDLPHSLPNLALQAGVVALMIWLYRLEK